MRPLAALSLTLLVAAPLPQDERCVWADDEADEEDDAAEEEDDDDGDGREGSTAPGRSINFAGTLGLTGMQDMVDARVPDSFLSLRAGVRYQFFTHDQEFEGAIEATRDQDRHDLTFYAGASALGFVDASISFPFVYDEEDRSINGAPDPTADYDSGWGNVTLAGKVTLQLGPLALAPYAYGKIPSGEPAVRDLAEFEYGVAGSLFLMNEYLGVHANIAGLQVEEGLSAVRFRVGASFVVWSEELLCLRLYGYGDAIEFEGSANADIDLEVGAQALLFQLITLDIGCSMRLVDAQHLDDSAREALESELGVFERHFEDDTWSVHVGVGIAF